MYGGVGALKVLCVTVIIMSGSFITCTSSQLQIKSGRGNNDDDDGWNWSSVGHNLMCVVTGRGCVVTILSDENIPLSLITQVFGDDDDIKMNKMSWSPHNTTLYNGLNIFEVHYNTTHGINSAIQHISKVGEWSWCLVVVVISLRPTFLSTFAQLWGEGGGGGRSRVVVVVMTSLPPDTLNDLMSEHWTYSMMNTITINDQRQPSNSFHGDMVNVTAMPFPPYWSEVNGIHQGTDYLLLTAVAQALNFTINVVPTHNWSQVTGLVQDRISFIAPIIYAMLPDRLQYYQFSYPYEYASPTFCLPKPVLSPQYLSLYYPLSHHVWLGVLIALVLMPLAWTLMQHIWKDGSRKSVGLVALEVIRTLLGQDMSRKGGIGWVNTWWTRVLVGTWLVYALILGAAYRGNLTAALTIPKFPPRPETLQELVNVVDRVTMPPYGAQFRDFYSKSDSVVFKSLAQKMELVNTAVEGLSLVNSKQSHIQVRRYLSLVIAEYFTEMDGSTKLYLGRESVFPGLSAWPIPHQAPYKKHLDRSIMAVLEAGLYEKWSKDVMTEAREEGRKKRQQQKGNTQMEAEEEKQDNKMDDGINIVALTLVHMQGPLILLLLGLTTAGLSFIMEILTTFCHK